jgi:hypothetical protein
VWEYMPEDGEHYCCEECVPRGCSCQTENPDGTGDLMKDELGRLLPCCEYMYNPEGFEPPLEEEKEDALRSFFIPEDSR